jgi:hypothetical protein
MSNYSAAPPVFDLPLGNKTRNPSTPRKSRAPEQPIVDEFTGEIFEEATSQTARAERFALQATSKSILGKDHRIFRCMHSRTPKQDVKIWKDKAHGKAFFSGVRTCGSVWACPICSAKISERRRHELAQAIIQAKAMGLHVKLLTATVPHGLGDDLETITNQLLKAWSKTTSGRVAANLRDLLGLVGTIRASEVTYGKNGFHPHFHVLLFLDKDWTDSGVKNAFTPVWQNACRLAGLPIPSDRHGVDVRDGTEASKYVSKWGLESEMTKGHSKKGKQGGMTPFDFLRVVFAQGEDAPRFAGLFLVFEKAFKGKRQLHWSTGLRKLLELAPELTDEEMAATQEESASVLATLSLDQWRGIAHARAQSHVLDVAETRPESLQDVLKALTASYLAHWKRRRET